MLARLQGVAERESVGDEDTVLLGLEADLIDGQRPYQLRLAYAQMHLQLQRGDPKAQGSCRRRAVDQDGFARQYLRRNHGWKCVVEEARLEFDHDSQIVEAHGFADVRPEAKRTRAHADGIGLVVPIADGPLRILQIGQGLADGLIERQVESLAVGVGRKWDLQTIPHVLAAVGAAEGKRHRHERPRGRSDQLAPLAHPHAIAEHRDLAPEAAAQLHLHQHGCGGTLAGRPGPAEDEKIDAAAVKDLIGGHLAGRAVPRCRGKIHGWSAVFVRLPSALMW